ncbi:hypothetical protein L9F63_004602, partial [Diploptera punctata]
RSSEDNLPPTNKLFSSSSERMQISNNDHFKLFLFITDIFANLNDVQFTSGVFVRQEFCSYADKRGESLDLPCLLMLPARESNHRFENYEPTNEQGIKKPKQILNISMYTLRRE